MNGYFTNCSDRRNRLLPTHYFHNFSRLLLFLAPLCFSTVSFANTGEGEGFKRDFSTFSIDTKSVSDDAYTCYSAEITGLVVVDRSNYHEVLTIYNGGKVNLSDLPASFYLKVKVGSGTESVSIDLNGHRICENVAAYTYPAGGAAWNATVGHYTLTAKTYTENKCESGYGYVCDQETFQFEVVDNVCEFANIEELLVINMQNYQEVLTISDGDVVNLADLPADYYLEIKTGSGTESVSLDLNGHRICENVAAYTYPAGGNRWNASLGHHTLTAKTYTENGCENNSSALCDERSFSFEVIDNECAAASVEGLVLVNRYNGSEILSIANGDRINLADLPSSYYLKVKTGSSTESVSIDLNGHKICENLIDYTYPAGGGYWNADVGHYTLTAKTYTENDCESGYGDLCDEAIFQFEMFDNTCDAAKIDALVLVDASSEEAVLTINDGDRISVDDLPSRYYLQVNAGEDTRSVSLNMNGHEICENYIPYTYPAGGQIWDAGVGSYTLVAKTYTDGSCQYGYGVLCDEISVQFEIVPACHITVNAGDDGLICDGSETTITASVANENECSTGGETDCDHQVVDYGGYTEYIHNAEICGDYAGTKLWTAGGYGLSYITIDLGKVVPVGTEICVATKLEHCSNTSANVSKMAIEISNNSASAGFATLVSGTTIASSSYQEFCYILNTSARYIKVINEANSCSMKVDYVSFETPSVVNTEITYEWSGPGIVGDPTGAAITVNQSGTYTVLVTDCSGCTASDDVVLTFSSPIIEGIAFEDTDRDGCYNNITEGIIGGLTVRLLDCNGEAIRDEHGDAMITTTDDVTGEYAFDICGLTEDVIVSFETPNNYTTTLKDVADCNGINSNIYENGDSDCVPSDPDGPDAGFYFCPNITGVAFVDTNSDGCFDVAESIVGDLTVYLLNCDGTDILDENNIPVTTTTDPITGFYVFENVCQYGENFIVKFDIPNGFAPTGVRDNEFCFEGAANSNIDEFGESVCVDDNPDGPDAGFVESLPELATSVQIILSEISPGGNTDIIYRIANLGSGNTDGTNITATLWKNPAFGSFTLHTLPTGWTVMENGTDYVKVTSQNIIQPVSIGGVVAFSANFQHDGDAENTTITFDIEIEKGSGGDQNEANNQNSAILSVNQTAQSDNG